MKEMWKEWVSLAVIFLLVPLVLLLIFHGKQGISLDGRSPIETYLPTIMLNRTYDDMEMETIKAQAVLVRSNLMKALEEGRLSFSDVKKEFKNIDLKTNTEKAEKYEQLATACEETCGEVLTYEGKLCYVPYYLRSNGNTRDAFAAIGKENYPYLVSVPSPWDTENENNIGTYFFTKEELYEKLQKKYPDSNLQIEQIPSGIEILERDAAGYILWIKIGETVDTGEHFRTEMGLPSADFSVDEADTKIRFLCRGVGHGFGLSQYGANAMAREGKTYQEILVYYFHGISIEKSV